MHKGGPLSKGILHKDIVICLWHGWKYSVITGQSPYKGGNSVNAYPVKIIEDKIYVNSVPSVIGKRKFNLMNPL